VPRRRFQKGRLTVRGVRNPQRVGLYREDVLLPDGKVGRVRRTVRLGPVRKVSERQARARFQPYLDRVNSFVKMPPAAGVTLEDFVGEWAMHKANNMKPSARRTAESHLKAHLLPKLGALTLASIDTRHVQAFVTWLAMKGLARKTIENILMTLSTILHTAKDWKYAVGDWSFSAVSLPQHSVKREPRSFTAEEAGRIIKGADEPYATIWAMYAMLGIRSSEGLALTVDALDFNRKIIYIRQSLDEDSRKIIPTKTKSSADTVPMPLALEKRLRDHIARRHKENPDGLIFTNLAGRPYSANKLRAKLHVLLKKLGIPDGSFHAWRHGATSELLENGAAPTVVQRQMRHSDARITLGVYGHVVGDAQRRAVEQHAERIEEHARKAQLEPSAVIGAELPVTN
jgi:integrase